MNKVVTLYNLLGIRQKIQDRHLRLLYLRDVWGLQQSHIMECEGVTHQSRMSLLIKEAKMHYGAQDIKNTAMITFEPEEIKYIQFLPREIINDMQVLAFMNHILGLNINHPFYNYISDKPNIRIAALADLGIQNVHLQKIFKKTQPSISMIVKRKLERSRELNRGDLRYDDTAPFKIDPQIYKQSFVMSGGN